MKQYVNPLIAACSLMLLPLSFAQASAPSSTPNYLQVSYNLSHSTNLSPQAIAMAFAGYQWALKTTHVNNKSILTIVDFSVSSAKDRMYVINVRTGAVLMSLPVAHGKGSGEGSRWATRFSNSSNSLESSIGVFVTKEPYYGEHGLSLRIKGLEPSNNNVYDRDVVIHPANYASRDFIRMVGRAGNSWGCFAVDPEQSSQLIRLIENGSVMYAYGRSPQYMASTKILGNTI